MANLTSKAVLTRRVFMNERGDVYVSPNADFLPSSESLVSRLRSPFNDIVRRWARDDFYYLAFVPVQPHFEGPVLGSLSTSVITIQSVKKGSRTEYILAADVMKEWIWLEKLVEVMQDLIMERLNPRKFPLETSMTWKPSSLGYSQAHASKKRAYRVARLAHSAFVLNLAFMSYTVMLLERQVKGNVWAAVICDVEDISVSAVDAFRASWVLNWAVPRVGAFVDICAIHNPQHNYQWFDEICGIVELGSCVPLWLFYGPIDRPPCLKNSLHTVARVFWPSQDEVNAAVACRNKMRCRTAPLDQTYVEPNSRQLPGESYDTFMKREAQWQQTIQQEESPSEQETRRDRGLRQTHQPLPTLAGPIVYQWVRDAKQEIRRMVMTKHVPLLWARTTVEDRVYNSYRDEYDVREPIGDVSESDDHAREHEREACYDEDRDNVGNAQVGVQHIPVDEYDPFALSRHFPKISMRPTSNSGKADSRDCVDGIVHSSSTTSRTVNTRMSVDPLALTMSTRYDFLSPTLPEGETYSCRTEGGRQYVSNVTSLYRTITHWSKEDHFTADSLPPVADFVAYTMLNVLPPPDICDLSPGCSISPPRKLDSNFLVTPLTNAEETIFVFKFQQKRRWEVAVTHALTVNQAQRAFWGVSPDIMVKNLVSRGIPFRTLRQVHEGENPIMKTTWSLPENLLFDGQPIGLGVMRRNSTPSYNDYLVYETIRDEILRRAHGRAALMEGGIIWRLAIGTVPLHNVLLGPELTRAGHHSVFNGKAYIDDQLNPQELAVIVGTYRIETVQSNKQASDSSWWPPLHVWGDSGMCLGYWTDWAEDWYQTRLAKIRSGQATVKTTTQWREEIKRARRDVRTFFIHTESFARDNM